MVKIPLPSQFLTFRLRHRLHRHNLLLVLLLLGSATSFAAKTYVVPPSEQTDSVQTVFSGTLYFSSNNGDWIEPSEYITVGRFLRAAQQYPETEIWLIGRADTTGTATFNQRLSEKRAATVGRYLVRKGIAAERIRTKGYGEDASLPSDRARRVEMRGIIPLPTKQVAAASPDSLKEYHSSAQPQQSVVITKQIQSGMRESADVNKSDAKDTAGQNPALSGQSSVSSASSSVETLSMPKRYLAVKTNLIAWAGTILNIAADTQVAEHVSVELPILWCPWYVSDRHAIKTFTIQPEARYWLAKPGEGHFFGLHAHMGWFNVKWNNNRYQDTDRPLLGAGISYGYLLPFNEHWAGEFTLGAGYANMKYNTYYNIDNGTKIDTRTKNYWGITRVGISVVYRLNIKK